jgi:hypothetical protein
MDSSSLLRHLQEQQKTQQRRLQECVIELETTQAVIARFNSNSSTSSNNIYTVDQFFNENLFKRAKTLQTLEQDSSRLSGTTRDQIQWKLEQRYNYIILEIEEL